MEGGPGEPRRADRPAVHDHDQQLALNAEAAQAMGHWWRKHVVVDEPVMGTVALTSQAPRVRTTSLDDLRAAYLWRLIERCKRECARRRLRGTRPTTLVITAWRRGLSLPRWAEQIAAILARNHHSAGGSDGEYNPERAKAARQEVRRFVLRDLALRPHIKPIMDVTAHFQVFSLSLSLGCILGETHIICYATHHRNRCARADWKGWATRRSTRWRSSSVSSPSYGARRVCRQAGLWCCWSLSTVMAVTKRRLAVCQAGHS